MDRAVSEERLSTADYIATSHSDRRAEPLEVGPESAAAGGAASAQALANPVENPEPLLPRDSGQELRARWDQVQASFVDEPRNAVQQADELVAFAIKRLAESFAGQRDQLERQWDRGGDVSTEDLRIALQKYRSFFQRLLAI